MKDLKINDGLANLKKALNALEGSLKDPISEDRDLGGVIMAFISVVEILWQVESRVLQRLGFEANSPRESFEMAFRAGLVKDATVWIEILQDRNRAAHTYNKPLALEMYSRISTKYILAFREASLALEEKVRSQAF